MSSICHIYLYIHDFHFKCWAIQTHYFIVFTETQLNNFSQDVIMLGLSGPSGRIIVDIQVPLSRKSQVSIKLAEFCLNKGYFCLGKLHIIAASGASLCTQQVTVDTNDSHLYYRNEE
jgi:hypothetical protein